MTIYVFDSGPFIALFRYYYPRQFPSLWKRFDEMVAAGQITSTREVFNELQGHEDNLKKWCKSSRKVFVTPTIEELAFVKEIFSVSHFQVMVRKRERLKGKPVADPFVIARAKCLEEGCVVTTEKNSPNAARIPNVCEHFKIDCVDLERFMEREQWQF